MSEELGNALKAFLGDLDEHTRGFVQSLRGTPEGLAMKRAAERIVQLLDVSHTETD